MLIISCVGFACNSRGDGGLVCVQEILLRQITGVNEGGFSPCSVWFDLSQLLPLASGPLRPSLLINQTLEQAKIDTPNIMSFLLAPLEDKKPTSAELNMLEGDSELIVVAGRSVYFILFPLSFFFAQPYLYKLLKHS